MPMILLVVMGSINQSNSVGLCRGLCGSIWGFMQVYLGVYMGSTWVYAGLCRSLLALGYHWLLLATIDLVGDNREFEV